MGVYSGCVESAVVSVWVCTVDVLRVQRCGWAVTIMKQAFSENIQL